MTTAHTTYPKIEDVRAEDDKTLRVRFDNGGTKLYDCKPLLRSEPFRPLNDDVIFRQVRTDTNGYGIVWNDDIDLAESELWLNGKDIAP